MITVTRGFSEPDEVRKEKRKLVHLLWSRRNKKKIAEYRKKRAEAHKLYQLEWNSKNREKLRTYHRMYWHRRGRKTVNWMQLLGL